MPPESFGVAAVAFLFFSDDGPDSMKLPVFGHQVLLAQDFRVNVPNAHGLNRSQRTAEYLPGQ